MRTRTLLLAVLLIFTLACSGSNRLTNPPVAGAYEFRIASNVTGGVTVVEANLAASGNQSSASGPNQVQILTLEKKVWYVNGVCAGATPGQNSMTANVSGGNIALTFNEGGYSIPGQGVLTGSSIAGSYTVTGSTCPDLANEIQLGYPAGTDIGGIAGSPAPALAGTFSGTLDLPGGTDNASLTLKENPDYTLTVSVQLTGQVDNGTFPFTGSAVGNVMFVSGSVSGHTVNLLGYYDRAGTLTGTPNSILVFDYDALSKAGLLLGQ